jgi:CopA family copper-resistance protein
MREFLMRRSCRIWVFLLLGILLYPAAQAYPAIVEYDLTIALEELNITGNPSWGMTINNAIPGPTLRFREGDTARIRVHNEMSVETSIHWHGILVPPGMDGVPYVSFLPIAPRSTFTCEFPIRQSGTYWYHSHSGFQEQRGVYGSIVIEGAEGFKADRDHVVVFSDWTDEPPESVLRTLKRGSDWYGIERGSSQSIFGAARIGRLGDYWKRELQRMEAMDIADVAYDCFLANGRKETTLEAGPGETVRLRLIDGSSTTFFYLTFAGGPLTVVSADGNEVEPLEVDRLLISVAETYDVRVKIPGEGAYELRATAQDGSSWTSVWLGSGERRYALSTPKPDLYQTMGTISAGQIFALTPAGAMGMADREVDAGLFDGPGMAGMGEMETGGMHDMAGMVHAVSKEEVDRFFADIVPAAPSPAELPPAPRRFAFDFGPLVSDSSSSKDTAVDGMDSRRPWPPYEKLRATAPTAFPADLPVREIRLTLDGDMERYVWFLNNKALFESDDILIRKGEVTRFILINRTMMHHPIHLHGHFFRVVNGQGDHAPLKHTVDVAPMSTTVIEFNAGEFGDWFFHCHLLYHMESGMARIVHYEGYQPGFSIDDARSLVHPDHWTFLGEADALSNMTDGALTLSNTRNILAAEWEAGWRNVEETRWETLITWARYVNSFFSFFAGANIDGSDGDAGESKALAGLNYLLPLNLKARVWADSKGGSRASLGREFILLPRLALAGEAEYDAIDKWTGQVGASYTLTRDLSLIARWHSGYLWGAGVRLRF